MDRQVEQRIRRDLDSREFKRAFEYAIRAYGAELRRYAASVIKDADEADEAYAIGLLNVWKGIESFRGESSFVFWAKRIIRYESLRLLKARKRYRSLSDAEDQIAAHPARSTTASYLRTSEKERVRAARAALPVRDQLVLALHVDWRFDFNSIEEIVGDSAGTWRARYKRAKAKLKEALEAQ